MLTCKQVVRMIDSEEPLTLRQRMGLRFHLMMCRHCSQFAKHLKMVVQGASVLLKKKVEVDKSVVREVEDATIEELHKIGQP